MDVQAPGQLSTIPVKVHKGNALLQQRLRAWQPMLSPTWVVLSFALLGLAFVASGVGMVIVNSKVVEKTLKYTVEPTLATDGTSQTTTVADVIIPIDRDMEAPVYVYYELTNFYQNHRRYVKSRYDTQFIADSSSVPSFESSEYKDCDPWIANDKGVVYYPCGLVGRSVFNDSFTFFLKPSENSLVTDITRIELDESPNTIAWKSDVDHKFKNVVPTTEIEDNLNMWILKYFPPEVCVPKRYTAEKKAVYIKTVQVNNKDYRKASCQNYSGKEATCKFSLFVEPEKQDFNEEFVCDDEDFERKLNPAGWGVENSHFIVWMRTAGLSKFRKLYGKINSSLKKGSEVIVRIAGNFPVSSFGGTKSIVISTVSALGGKNSFLGIAYIVVGSIAIIFSIVFGLKHAISPRSQSQVQYLD